MGILGNVKLRKRSREVVVALTEDGEEFKVTVKAPPLQLATQLQVEIPNPEPPALVNDNGQPRFKTNPRTGEPLKEDGKLVPMVNKADPAYRQELLAVSEARTIAMIFHCVEFPGKTKVVQNGNPVRYWLSRWKELEDAGLDVGSFNRLARACTELSAPMSKGEIEEARAALGTDTHTQHVQKEKLGKKAPKGKSG